MIIGPYGQGASLRRFLVAPRRIERQVVVDDVLPICVPDDLLRDIEEFGERLAIDTAARIEAAAFAVGQNDGQRHRVVPQHLPRNRGNPVEHVTQLTRVDEPRLGEHFAL